MFKKKKSIYEEWFDKHHDSINHILQIPMECCMDDRENAILREAVARLQVQRDCLADENFMLEKNGEYMRNRIIELEKARDSAFTEIRCLRKKIKELEEQVGDIRPGDYVAIVAPKYHFDREGDIMQVHSVSADGLCIKVRNCDLARRDDSYPFDYLWTYTKHRVVKIHSDVDARYKLDKIRKIIGEN